MKYFKCLFIFILTFILIFPLVWMFVGSVQDLKGLMRMPPRFIPAQMTLRNYKDMVLETAGTLSPVQRGQRDLRTPEWFLRWVINTVVIIAFKFMLVVATSAMVGYAFSVFDFRYKKQIFLLYIVQIILPPTMLIPTFMAVKWLGLYDTWWGILLPAAYAPVCMYIFKNHIDTIPRALVDSARMDGAGDIRILSDIILPMCKPTIGVIGVMVSLGTLGDYIWTVLILPSKENWTMMVGIMSQINRAESIQGSLNPLGYTLAGGCILFIPMFLLFAFFQRYFEEGITIGAVKA